MQAASFSSICTCGWTRLSALSWLSCRMTDSQLSALLHGLVIMSPHLSFRMVVVVWVVSLINSEVLCTLILNMTTCEKSSGSIPVWVARYGQDSLCRHLSSWKVCFGLGNYHCPQPLNVILISYGFISKAMVKMKSKAGQIDAANTCGSHLSAMTIFYDAIICMYLQAGSSASIGQGRFVILFYTTMIPSLNLLIYTLKNKDMKSALKRLIGFHHETTKGKRNWRWQNSSRAR